MDTRIINRRYNQAIKEYPGFADFLNSLKRIEIEKLQKNNCSKTASQKMAELMKKG